MTSLWNRIRSAKANGSETRGKDEIKNINSNTVTSAANSVNTQSTSSSIVTPWTISPNLLNRSEPVKEFWIRTCLFRVSSQKLNLLGRQISRLPVPTAALQMKFSVKKAAKEVNSLLLQAQSRITKFDPMEGRQVIDPSKFIVQQALVGSGPYLKRIDIKGRGRHGVIWRPHSFMRLQIALPDEDALLKKRFKVRIAKESKPVMTRLNY